MSAQGFDTEDGKKSRKGRSKSKKNGGVVDMDRTFLELAGGEQEVEIKRLETNRAFKHNPFMGRLFQLVAAEGNDKISLKEYKTALNLLESSDKEEKYDLAFRVYDMDNDGFISQKDLLHWMNKHKGQTKHLQSHKQMVQVARSTIEAYDVDKDGKLSREEFKPLMNHQNNLSYFGL